MTFYTTEWEKNLSASKYCSFLHEGEVVAKYPTCPLPKSTMYLISNPPIHGSSTSFTLEDKN